MKTYLESLATENFKGLKHFQATFGPNTTILGENGSGKTTVYDAFLWLLFGKDSSGRKDFEVRPLDEKNQPIRGLVVSVIGVLNFDGDPHTFRKEQQEKTVKGQFRGYETLCWIDEVPKKVGEYADAIKELIDEDTFKLLTDVYFFGSKMHWTERRKTLLKMAGKIGEPKGFDRLLSALKGRSVDEYKEILRGQKKRDEKERDEISPRIDEIQRGLTEYAESGEATDTAALEGRRVEINTAIEQLDQSRSAILNQENARQKKIDRLNTLKSKKSTREAELQNDTTGVQHLLDDRVKLNVAVSERQQGVQRAESDLQGQDGLIEQKRQRQTTLQDSLLRIVQRYRNEKDVKIDLSGTACKNCGQPLPADKIRTMQSEQEAKQKELLFSIADDGNKTKKEIEAVQQEIDSLNKKRIEMQEKLAQAKILLQEAEENRTERLAIIEEQLQHRPKVDPKDDPIWKQVAFDIQSLSAEIGEPASKQLQDIEFQRQARQQELTKINETLAQSDRMKKDAERIEELNRMEKELSQHIADADDLLAEIDRYKADQSAMIEKSVNGLFKYVNFKLFKELINGGFEDCCEATFNGIPYPDMSYGQRVFVGVDIINALSKHYGVSVPLYIDNAESLTLPIEADTQIIRLVADPDKSELEIRTQEYSTANQ